MEELCDLGAHQWWRSFMIAVPTHDGAPRFECHRWRRSSRIWVSINREALQFWCPSMVEGFHNLVAHQR